MFFRKLMKSAEDKADRLAKHNEELEKENKTLRDDRARLKEEVEDLKVKKKVSEEDIKHMTKMKEEKLQIEHEKKTIQLEREKQAAIAKVKDEYQDKQEKTLNKQIEDGNKKFEQILERLPNMSVRLKGDV